MTPDGAHPTSHTGHQLRPTRQETRRWCHSMVPRSPTASPPTASGLKRIFWCTDSHQTGPSVASLFLLKGGIRCLWRRVRFFARGDFQRVMYKPKKPGTGGTRPAKKPNHHHNHVAFDRWCLMIDSGRQQWFSSKHDEELLAAPRAIS